MFSNPFEIPHAKSPFDPPREIELSESQEKKAEASIKILQKSSLTISSLYDAFNDWKSSRTIAMRRLSVTLSSLIAGSYFIGVDISNLSVLGIALHDGDAFRFFLLIFGLVLIFSILFFSFVYIDFLLRRSRIARLERFIGPCVKASQYISSLASAVQVKPLELINDFQGGVAAGKGPDADDAYDAVMFYQEHLAKPRAINIWLDRGELLFVAILTLASLLILGNIMLGSE